MSANAKPTYEELVDAVENLRKAAMLVLDAPSCGHIAMTKPNVFNQGKRFIIPDTFAVHGTEQHVFDGICADKMCQGNLLWLMDKKKADELEKTVVALVDGMSLGNLQRAVDATCGVAAAILEPNHAS